MTKDNYDYAISKLDEICKMLYPLKEDVAVIKKSIEHMNDKVSNLEKNHTSLKTQHDELGKRVDDISSWRKTFMVVVGAASTVLATIFAAIVSHLVPTLIK